MHEKAVEQYERRLYPAEYCDCTCFMSVQRYRHSQRQNRFCDRSCVQGYDNVRKLVTWADAFSVVLYGHLYLALPLIASIASLPIICDELRTNNFYFHFSRIGVKHYIHLKYLSCIVSGVGALFLGLILYGIFVRLFFPSSYDFGGSQVIGIIENNSFRMIISSAGYLLYMLCYVAMLSIFSCGW